MVDAPSSLCDFRPFRGAKTIAVKKTITGLSLAILSQFCALPAQATAIPKDVLWRTCPTASGIPSAPRAEADYEPGTTAISADQVKLIEGGISTLDGNVEVIRDQTALTADQVQYDSDAATVQAEGNVNFWDSNLFWQGAQGHVDLEQKAATFRNGKYRLIGRQGRGHAGSASINNSEHTADFKNVDYTTCPGEIPAWKLAGKDIHLNNNTDVGTAKHVTLQIHDVPVFYLPYFTFPLTDHRKSGFLPPSFGSSSNSGIDLSIPYYWNIAPNYDATITPRFLGDRGAMLKGEFRYLWPQANGQVNFDFLPNDRTFKHDQRDLFGFRHYQSFSHGHAFLTYNRVSDKRYFEDFGSSLSLASTRFLEQRAELAYSGRYWTLTGRAQGYQTVDRSSDPLNRPYKRLPQLLFTTQLPHHNRQLNFDFHGEAVYFDRDAGVIGGRFDLMPTLSYPINSDAGFFKPRLSLRQTNYLLDRQTGVTSSSESRTLPVLSLDSGLYFERDLAFGSHAYLQTLEPRLFYLYIPDTNQDQLPIFDTGEFNLSFDQFFREDRFTGPDRIGDANQITVALTSRLLGRDTGREKLRASIGQIYYLANRNVHLPGKTVITDSLSPFIAEVAARINDDWRTSATLQWDPNSSKTDKAAVNLRYRPDNGAIFNAAYRLRRTSTLLETTDDVEQTDISFRWPLNPAWSLVGRWNYSLAKDRSLETVGGVEYNSCCWGLRLVGRRFLTSSTGKFDNGLFLQVQLKGLGGFGHKTERFLRRSIPGYTGEF